MQLGPQLTQELKCELIIDFYKCLPWTKLTVVVVVLPDVHELGGGELLQLPRVGVTELPHEVGRRRRQRLRLPAGGLQASMDQ